MAQHLPTGMLKMIERASVLNWVGKLTDKQFVEFFYQAVEGRHLYADDPVETHLVLANVTREAEDGVAKSAWRVQLLALPTPDQRSEWIDEALICQYAQCCGVAVASWAKEMICPSCGRALHGT